MNRTDYVARDWPALAAEAGRIHAARQRHADQLAEKGDTERAAPAADRARVSGALAAMWRAIVDHQPEPELQASHAEIRQDLAGIRDMLTQRAARAPDEVNAEQLARVQALIDHHFPWWPGADRPHILFLYSVNQEARRRWPRPSGEDAVSTEGGRHVTRSAERAPTRQTAAPVPRAAVTKPQSKQEGLF
ncbi:hypothetical protein CA234_20680 [Sphingomonas sp. ABOLE]|uniref:hypothetical protein n=1 Tax=Sphingomonas sp. ABOLE TaxID=1985878 RepID=UPI000F7EF8F2|nr:hypothetical protein [Sphingomonas sp. ABOLE]RSV34842.1 hypothetical protein CA234_20680 [Sphingomonas sp. ABOLE]